MTAFETAMQKVRTPQPAAPIILQTGQYNWTMAVRAKVATGLSRLEAIKAVMRERPDLYRASVVPHSQYRAVH
jgi:hypothetical protein